MNDTNVVVRRLAPDGTTAVLSTNKLIRNTYALLSMTLIFSAAMATVSVLVGAPYGISFMCSIAALLLVWFVLPRFRNSAAAVPIVFLFTGLLGFGLGPMLSYYLGLPNGNELVLTAAGGTGVIFLGLSGYVMTTRKNFNFMGGFLVIGMLVMIVAMLANLFLQLPGMHLAISSIMVVLMSGFILYDTSRIINGGETNYVFATVALFLDIIILFQHLLSLLGAMRSE